MEKENVGFITFIQESFRGFMKCLGLERGGGDGTATTQPPLIPAASTTYYEPQTSEDEPSITADTLVEVPSTPVDNTQITTNENSKDESNVTLVTIDEIINAIGGTTVEAHYVELDIGKANTNLLTTSLISSGGGGKIH